MDKKHRDHKKKTKHRKSGVFSNCLSCISKNIEDEDEICNKAHSLHSTRFIRRHDAFKTFSSESSTFALLRPELQSNGMSPNNALLSQVYIQKLANPPEEKIPVDPNLEMERIQKDQLIKSILGKYLAVKREEMLKEKPNATVDKRQSLTTATSKNDCLGLRCCTSESSETLVLENDNIGKNQQAESPRPQVNFPTRCKSAPTNCLAHDSLADICCKMNKFKQQENASDSYVTCCSEENIGDTQTNKKKLELTFQSSEEVPCFEDNSTMLLRYEISCEKSIATRGISGADVFQEARDEDYECLKHTFKTNLRSPVVYLNSFGKEEIEEVTSSSSSLKWKLIISHHGHGDIR